MKEKQAEKLKSCKMKEGWMKNDEGWMKNDEWWMKNDEGWRMMISSCWGILWLIDRRMDICECRVAFATENLHYIQLRILKGNR